MKRGKRSSWLKWGLWGVALLLIAGCECGPGEPPEWPEKPEPEPEPNSPPVISSLTANPVSVEAGGTSRVTVAASDPDGDPLSYSWTATGGTLSPVSSSSSTTWTAPQSPGTYTVTVTVRDDRGGSVSRSVNIVVAAPPPPPPAPARRENIGVEEWQEVPPR